MTNQHLFYDTFLSGAIRFGTVVGVVVDSRVTAAVQTVASLQALLRPVDLRIRGKLPWPSKWLSVGSLQRFGFELLKHPPRS